MEIVAVIGTVEPDKLVGIVEKYFAAWRMCVGLARAPRTLFLSRAELLNALGQELIPKVLCLVLRQLGVTLDAEHERAGVYLTNALTGWEPHGNKPLAFPKLEEERGKAE